MSKQKMKNLLIPVFALLVLMGTLVISSVAEAATIKYKGKSGDINWSIDTNGHLLLQGKGDYVIQESPTGLVTERLPWLEYWEEIKSVTAKVSGITNCSFMFANLNATQFDLSQLDTSNVTNMDYMFYSCEKLKVLYVSNWNVRKVTRFWNVFGNCHELEHLDLSSWDLRGLEDEILHNNNAFMNLTAIKTLKTPKNCKAGIVLAKPGVWRDSNGKVYTDLPRYMSKSITLSFEPKATYICSNPWGYVSDPNEIKDGCYVAIEDLYTVSYVRVRYTGLIDVKGTYYYVEDGYVKFAPTLVKHKNKWYYVSGGRINKATTLVKYGSTYYYVSGGTINYSTTLVKYGSKYYYVIGGKHVKATTLVKYAGNYWYVKNGVLSNETTLVKYNNKYYYVQNGKYRNVTTLVKYGNKYYFVQKGIVNFNYTGTFVYNGVRWNIVKGVVTGRV